MIHQRFVFPLMAALGLAACSDSSPTANEGQLDEASFELVAEAALEANDQQGTPLPSLDNLLRRTYQAIGAQGGHPKGQRLLKAGQTLNAIVAVLGPGVADEALTGVNQALSRLDDRLAGKTLPDRIQETLDRAKALAERGHAGVAAERYAAALGAALASADLIRSLSPRFQAGKAIDRATRAYKAAREAVAVDPTEDEKTDLKKALRLVNGAKDAYEGKEFRKAGNLAGQSLAFSLEVLKGRSGG
ncbi:MAG: hypothetical protein ABIF09_02310 [Gemmatimonadota bacterium]